MKRAIVLFVVLVFPISAIAQDVLPADNGLATYHTTPRYRESESHPLRIFAYIVHPIGWVMREAVFRPLSYFASSTETTRSVMGYREPYDYRQPECFSADDSTPDCRTISPFNYDSGVAEPEPVMEEAKVITETVQQVYFPNVNFDFDSRKLNALGKGRVQQIAAILRTSPSVHVVLQGHADYIGSDAYNEKLGMDRADAVRQELITSGIAPERLSAVSFGETQPVYAEQEDWARAINRRVEVHPDEGAAAPN
ncbi:MAG: OmpA family protein [Deltaproteobacteria bacterium]|nr:OmpA family protein [Deltaproteobacteria bacterium]